MRKSVFIATVLSVGTVASQVQAQAVAIRGSDTLLDVTNDVLAACAGDEGLTYIGGGTGTGENAMVAGTQDISPMSRFIGAGVCAANPNGQGLVIGLDALSIVRSAIGQTSCDATAFTAGESFAVSEFNSIAANVRTGAALGSGALECPGCTGSTYSFADWKDVLRVVFFGIHRDGTVNCNSDVRHSLVNTWGNLFEGTCAGEGCTQLRHAFRRNDLSGTTDTFKSLVASSSAVFCNGTDTQNNDPIVRTCSTTGQDICQVDGKLGLVLPINVQPLAGAVSPHNTTACVAGRFGYRPHPLVEARCPNGSAKAGGNCLVPLDAAGNAGCVSTRANRPVGSLPTVDGRAYNLIIRAPSGVPLNNVSGTPVRSAFYRLHANRVTATGAATCALIDSTIQIGCLAAANGCSIGFAGREVDQVANTSILRVNGIAGSNDNVRAGTFPLSRRLYLASLKGFGTLVAGGRGTGPTAANQRALTSCFANPAIINSAIAGRNYVTVSPDLTAPIAVQNCAP